MGIFSFVHPMHQHYLGNSIPDGAFDDIAGAKSSGNQIFSSSL